MPRTPTPLEISRRQAGISQQQLAQLAGVSRHTVIRVERGDLPRVRTAQALARALRVPLNDVLNDDEAPARAPRVTDRPKRAAARAKD
ncbi:MAG: helix-turn-helix protein [Conexibacter sp.]|nr:helix-turn-helix protein [Conexibacter sp.]